MNQNYQISDLIIYPIKSLGGIHLTQSVVDPLGLQYDRRYMLVDENNNFLSQRELPQLCLFSTTITNNGLTVLHQNFPEQKLKINFSQQLKSTNKVFIWDDEVLASEVSEEANQFFSDLLNFNCKLVKIIDQSQRNVDARYALNKETTSFTDGYQILIIGQESLNNLNSKLVEPIEMNRFRPNIVFTGGNAFDEDNFKEFKINNTVLKVVKPCSRCVVTTINQQTAKVSKEPLKTLATYRNFNSKILFGQNVLVVQSGIVSVGDKLQRG